VSKVKGKVVPVLN